MNVSQCIGFSWTMASSWLRRRLGLDPYYLPILLLFVTNRCNLQCAMCGVWEQQHPPGETELSLAEWQETIRQARGLGTRLLAITGGEPLLADGLPELVASATGAGIAVHICSNGTLLTEENIRALRAAGMRSVSVSLESDQPAVHDALRGAGNFAGAVAGIRRLRAIAPEVRVGINCLITARNFRGLDRMVPFAELLDVQRIKFAPIHTNLQHKNKLRASFGDLLFGEEYLVDLEREVRKLLPVLRRSRLQTTAPGFLQEVTRFYRYPQPVYCYAGYLTGVINPYGYVTACCDQEGRVSVRQQSLADIWRGPALRELRARAASCCQPCWDTTNVELSLRLSPGSLLGNFRWAVRDLLLHFRGGAP